MKTLTKFETWQRCRKLMITNLHLNYMNHTYNHSLIRYQFRFMSTEKLDRNVNKMDLNEKGNKNENEYRLKSESHIPSYSNSVNVIIKAPLIFFCVAFGAVVLLQGRQGMESVKLPEQYQWFKRYIRTNPTIMDELGIPIKISGGSTNIDIHKDEDLKFDFEIQGEFGTAKVFCHRIKEEITDGNEQGFNRKIILNIYAITNSDLGERKVEIVDKTSFE